MSLADWEDLTGGADMILDTTHVHAGLKSLKIAGKNYARAVKVLKQSQTPSPTVANVVSWGYTTSVMSRFAFFFRVQDVENYYRVTFKQQTGADIHVTLGTRIAGVPDQKDAQMIDGAPLDEWIHYKVMFCEIAGSIYASVYVGGVLKADLVDPSPSFPGGGRVGVGAPHMAGSTGYTWIDDTEIYY